MPLGAPIFDYEDKVVFSIVDADGEPIELTGKIYIIDAYGIFADNTHVYYDIFVEDHPQYDGGCLFKHIPEAKVRPL